MPRKGRSALNLAKSGDDVFARLLEIGKTGYFGYETTQMCVLEFKTSDAAEIFFTIYDNEKGVFTNDRRPILSYAAENIA